MHFPPLLRVATIEEYRAHYEREYCREPLLTFDGIPVWFSKSRFHHAFYESSRRDGRKDTFSRARAERMAWIMATLKDPCAELYQGWLARRRRYEPRRRVAVVCDDYVVVIALGRRRDGQVKGEFVTAFQASSDSIKKIRRSPRWTAVCLHWGKKKGR